MFKPISIINLPQQQSQQNQQQQQQQNPRSHQRRHHRHLSCQQQQQYAPLWTAILFRHHTDYIHLLTAMKDDMEKLHSCIRSPFQETPLHLLMQRTFAQPKVTAKMVEATFSILPKQVTSKWLQHKDEFGRTPFAVAVHGDSFGLALVCLVHGYQPSEEEINRLHGFRCFLAGEKNVKTFLAAVSCERLVACLNASQLSRNLQQLQKEEDTYCPISQMPPQNPVLMSDSFVYDKDHLLRYFKRCKRSPMTGMPMQPMGVNVETKKIVILK
jgi:hypothetical protein